MLQPRKKDESVTLQLDKRHPILKVIFTDISVLLGSFSMWDFSQSFMQHFVLHIHKISCAWFCVSGSLAPGYFSTQFPANHNA